MTTRPEVHLESTDETAPRRGPREARGSHGPWAARLLTASLLVLGSCSQPPLPDDAVMRTQLATRFGNLDGVFLLRRLDAEEPLRVIGRLDPNTRVAPCSTFKIPNALIGLATGVLEGPDDQIAWNGDSQPIRSWERDHTLRTAIQNSVLWYFQDVARRVRPERMATYLEDLAYGRGVLEPTIDSFWLTNEGWTISPAEQIEFLTRLYRDELPLLPEPVEIVRSLLVLETRNGATYSGKTGSSWPQADGLTIGWFVGHVHANQREYVFATLVRAPQDAFGKQARQVTEAILNDLGVWRQASFAAP